MTLSKRTLFIVLISSLCVITVMVWRTMHPLPHPITIKVARFSELPHWESANMQRSLHSFQLSCDRLLRQNPNKVVGNRWISLSIKDWFPACKQAITMNNATPKEAKVFFQTWFQPITFDDGQPITGLFTGYYVPSLNARLVKNKDYTVPIYGTPRNLIKISLHDFDKSLPDRDLYGRVEHKQFKPFYSREDIDRGALKNQAPILAYVQSPTDRLFMEVQGSGILILEDGSPLYLGYAGKNGLPYTAIGRALLDKGILNSKTISLQSIKSYLETHLEERDAILHSNRSFVFFKVLDEKGAFGTQGAKLTPGYSMAVDTHWIPLGLPIWLSASRPDAHSDHDHPLHRLLIAQDTGGAIKGAVRGDVFWGAGENSAAIAGKMKHHGQYWILIPRKT